MHRYVFHAICWSSGSGANECDLRQSDEEKYSIWMYQTTRYQHSRLQSTGTGNDIDELVGDRGLTATVVLELQVVDHVSSVLGRVVHGVATRTAGVSGRETKRPPLGSLYGCSYSPSADFAGVALDQDCVKRICERELGKVLCNVILHFIRPESGCKNKGTVSDSAKRVQQKLCGNGVPDSLSASAVSTSIIADSYESAETNLLYTIAMLSYSTPDFRMRSATPAASANVGTSRPIWLKAMNRFLLSVREICDFALSPTTAMGELRSSSVSFSLNTRRVAFATEEWMPPHMPLSEETTMKSLRLPGVSAGACWNTSVCEQ